MAKTEIAMDGIDRREYEVTDSLSVEDSGDSGHCLPIGEHVRTEAAFNELLGALRAFSTATTAAYMGLMRLTDGGCPYCGAGFDDECSDDCPVPAWAKAMDKAHVVLAHYEEHPHV